MDITFITGNEAKAQEIEMYLGQKLNRKKIDLPEIQSLVFETVVQAKAEAAFSLVSSPVLVEDTGLVLSCIAPLPGPLIKWFWQALGNEGITDLAVRFSKQEAIATTYFDLYDGKEHRLFTGSSNGLIATTPRGETAFGWDPIFIPEGEHNTWAEMSAEDKERTSMRKKALLKLKEYLELEK